MNYDKDLINEEKIKKMEGEVARMRGESLKSIDDLHKANKKIIEFKL